MLKFGSNNAQNKLNFHSIYQLAHKMTKTYFVTGTDTEIGKTFTTSLILKVLAANGYRVVGLKPIASDSYYCQIGSYSGLVNDDAKQILLASNIDLSYPEVNPVVFEQAIAPHIAAAEQAVSLNCKQLTQLVKIPDADLCLIEGAGGWLTPLNQTETYADWVIQQGYEVILVVGMKLGCLNHAQLTAQAIRAKGVKIKGWVANQLESDMQVYQQNLEWLKSYFNEPLLAEIKYQQKTSDFIIQSLESLLT